MVMFAFNRKSTDTHWGRHRNRHRKKRPVGPRFLWSQTESVPGPSISGAAQPPRLIGLFTNIALNSINRLVLPIIGAHGCSQWSRIRSKRWRSLCRSD